MTSPFSCHSAEKQGPARADAHIHSMANGDRAWEGGKRRHGGELGCVTAACVTNYACGTTTSTTRATTSTTVTTYSELSCLWKIAPSRLLVSPSLQWWSFPLSTWLTERKIHHFTSSKHKREDPFWLLGLAEGEHDDTRTHARAHTHT